MSYRPDRHKYYTIRLEYEMFVELQKAAAKDKTNVAELIRTFIEWGLENRFEEK